MQPPIKLIIGISAAIVVIAGVVLGVIFLSGNQDGDGSGDIESRIDSGLVADDGFLIEAEELKISDQDIIREMEYLASKSDSTDIHLVATLMGKKYYKRALKAIKDTGDDRVKYLKGVIYFCMSLNKVDPPGVRLSFRDEAVNILEGLSESTDNKVLQVKSRLWLGMSVHVLEYTPDNKDKALLALKYIEENWKDSPYYNDALYFQGIVYKYHRDKESARSYYTLTASANTVDDQIFDPYEEKFLTCSEASQLGLSQVK